MSRDCTEITPQKTSCRCHALPAPWGCGPCSMWCLNSKMAPSRPQKERGGGSLSPALPSLHCLVPSMTWTQWLSSSSASQQLHLSPPPVNGHFPTSPVLPPGAEGISLEPAGSVLDATPHHLLLSIFSAHPSLSFLTAPCCWGCLLC